MISSLTNQDYTLRLKAAFQMFLLTVMGLVLGTFYVLGALTLSIEDAANPPGSLYGVWSLFISFMGIFGIGAMTWTGSFLNKGVVPKPGETLPFMMTKTGRMKFIFLISSVLLSSLVVSGYSVSISSAFLLFCSASPFGMGLYTLYVVSLEHATSWNPQSPGLAVGWAKAVMLTGSIIMPGICSYLITTHGIVNALYIIAVLCSGVTFTTSLFIEWAPHDYKQRIEQSAPMISNHNSTSRAYVRHQIPLKELVLIKQFWMYLLVVLSTQMVYPFFAYFFKIGHSFGQSLPQLVPFFQNIFLIALFLRIFVGFLLDRLKFGTGMFSLGSKNMLLFSFPLQAVALVCLLPISEAGDFHAFVILCGVVLLTFLITQSTIPVLALEQFGPTNSAIVFGVGSGVGLGVGEFGTMVLAGIIEKRGMSNGVLTPASYNNYYLIASAGTIVGLVLCLAIRPYTVEEGNMKDGKILEMESGEQEYLLKESDYAAVE